MIVPAAGRLTLRRGCSTGSGDAPVDQQAESMVSKTMQCGFESHPGHPRSPASFPSPEPRPEGRGVTDAVHPKRVGPARGAWRAARHDHDFVAFVTTPDVQERLLDLAHHG